MCFARDLPLLLLAGIPPGASASARDEGDADDLDALGMQAVKGGRAVSAAHDPVAGDGVGGKGPGFLPPSLL